PQAGVRARARDREARMTLTRVVGKGRTSVMPRAELDALRGAYLNCAVDVGTGDARYAYHLASERSDWLVLGLDALDEPLGEIARGPARKPARWPRGHPSEVRRANVSTPVMWPPRMPSPAR